MMGLRAYLALGGVGVMLGLFGYGYTLWSDNAALTAQIASRDRSIAALTMQNEQSALARDVEEARAERFAVRADELNASVEALLTGDIPDANLDPRLADFINGLRRTTD